MRVVGEDEFKNEAKVTTATDGSFALTQLYPGWISIKAHLPGNKKHAVEARVKAGDTAIRMVLPSATPASGAALPAGHRDGAVGWEARAPLGREDLDQLGTLAAASTGKDSRSSFRQPLVRPLRGALEGSTGSVEGAPRSRARNDRDRDRGLAGTGDRERMAGWGKNIKFALIVEQKDRPLSRRFGIDSSSAYIVTRFADGVVRFAADEDWEGAKQTALRLLRDSRVVR